MKSTIVYVIRGKNGIIEKADQYLYQSLLDISEDIIVYLCGNFAEVDSYEVFRKITQVVYKNAYDYSDYEVLRDVIRQNKIMGDELIFVNNSLLGPFSSLQVILNEMRSKQLDFWGLTRMGRRITYDWIELPAHLQLDFFVIEKPMLESIDMKQFFDNEISSEKLGIEFTIFFEKAGFTWGSYINIERYNDNTVTNNIDLRYNVNCELLEKYQYPFIKKDYFITKSIENSNADDLKMTVDYIRDNHLYEMDMLWECILHTYNISDIKNAMKLCYILPEQSVYENELDKVDYQKTVIVMHMAYEESIEEAYHYILDIPKGIKIILVVINDELRVRMGDMLKANKDLNYEVRVMTPNRGRDMNGLFVTCRDVWSEYKYLCFTHDKRTSGATGAYTVGKTFMKILWDNTVKTGGYISNIIATLKKDKYLGFLTVPAPYHAGYFRTIGDAWGKSFLITKELAKGLGLNVPIEEDKLPFAIGNGFWCKTDALKDIVDYHLETTDFHKEPMPSDGTISHALERIMTYAAQNRGYYSGVVESISYAQSEIASKNYMLQTMLKQAFDNPYHSAYTTFERFLKGLENRSFVDFLNQHSKVYIFGAGKSGYDINYNLKKLGYEVQGYICSDGYKKPEEGDLPVYYLSEMDIDNPEVGIILAVHKKFYKELSEQLVGLGEKVFYL